MGLRINQSGRESKAFRSVGTGTSTFGSTSIRWSDRVVGMRSSSCQLDRQVVDA
jgi:hypothetical protein